MLEHGYYMVRKMKLPHFMRDKLDSFEEAVKPIRIILKETRLCHAKNQVDDDQMRLFMDLVNETLSCL